MLRRIMSWSRTPSTSSTSDQSSTASSPSEIASEESFDGREEVHLPDEIILEILSYFPEGKASQSTLWACCLINRQWHNLAVSNLYSCPWLYGWNYEIFAKTICPSKNAHIRKSDLAGLVRTLDMSKLAYQGSKSTTARVLGRTKSNLEVFVPPQANWGINCIAALSRCTKMKVLDLSVLSEAMSYRELSRIILNMKELRILRFPRCAAKHEDAHIKSHMQWPPLLEDLTLSGELEDFVRSDTKPAVEYNRSREPELPPPVTLAANVPPNVTQLTIQHSRIDEAHLLSILDSMGKQLSYLGLRCLPSIDMIGYGLSSLLRRCPNLRNLMIAKELLDLGSPEENPFDDADSRSAVYKTHPLRQLYVGTTGRTGSDDNMRDKTEEIHYALGHGALPRLRTVTFERCFGMEKKFGEIVPAVGALDVLLNERCGAVNGDEEDYGVRFVILHP